MTTSPMVRARRAGVTILELLVVMTMIGVMVAMIAPKLRVSPNQYARIAARRLMQDVEVARNRALSLKRVTQVQFTTATNQYVTYGDNDGDGAIAGNNAEIVFAHAFGTRQLQDGVIMGRGSAPNVPGEAGSGAVTFTGAQINFDTRGLPTPFGTKGTVYFTTSTNSDVVYAVQMSGAGSFKMWTYNASAGAWQ